jgi:hypothetical protein
LLLVPRNINPPGVPMKKSLFLAVALVLDWLTVAMAQVWVNPYTGKDETHVKGHYRNNPDGNPYNNWSYPGNTNPYTGKQATGDANRYLNKLLQSEWFRPRRWF